MGKRQVSYRCVQHRQSLMCVLFLQLIGPLCSDTHVEECMQIVGTVAKELEDAEDGYNQALQAGSYYNVTEGASEGLDSCDALRKVLEVEESRMLREDVEFRSKMTIFSKFVRLENAETYPQMHGHQKVRTLTRYFAAVVLQAYVRRKQERVRFCSLGTFQPLLDS